MSALGKHGIRRNNLDNWERRSFPQLGISAEIPKDIYIPFDIKPGNPKEDSSYGYGRISLFVHKKTYDAFSEPWYVVGINIDVLTEGQYALYKNSQRAVDEMSSPNDNNIH